MRLLCQLSGASPFPWPVGAPAVAGLGAGALPGGGPLGALVAAPFVTLPAVRRPLLRGRQARPLLRGGGAGALPRVGAMHAGAAGPLLAARRALLPLPTGAPVAGGGAPVLGRAGAPPGSLPACAFSGASDAGRAVGVGAYPGVLGAASRQVLFGSVLPSLRPGAVVVQAVAAPAPGIAGALSDVRGLADVPHARLGRRCRGAEEPALAPEPTPLVPAGPSPPLARPRLGFVGPRADSVVPVPAGPPSNWPPAASTPVA